MDFLEIFTSGRYHRDMKILKILASNSKRFRFYGVFKKWQIDDRGEGGGQILQFLRQVLFKITFGLKNPPTYVFWLKKLKNDIEIALKLDCSKSCYNTGIKLWENPIKIYHAVYICEKKDVAL